MLRRGLGDVIERDPPQLALRPLALQFQQGELRRDFGPARRAIMHGQKPSQGDEEPRPASIARVDEQCRQVS